jgi:hypothetical protein
VRSFWDSSIVYGTGFVAFWAWVALRARALDVWLACPLPTWCGPLGAGLLVPGAALALLAIGQFVVRGQGTPAPFDAPLCVVIRGSLA